MRGISFELLQHLPATSPKHPARRGGPVELFLSPLKKPPPEARGVAKHPPVGADVQGEKPGSRYLENVQKPYFDGIVAVVEGTLQNFRRAEVSRAYTQRQNENAFRSHGKTEVGNQKSGVRSQESEYSKRKVDLVCSDSRLLTAAPCFFDEESGVRSQTTGGRKLILRILTSDF